MISKQTRSRYISIVILLFAILALFLAQSAYWVNHSVFNQAKFSSITTTALLSESSRDAISKSVVNTVLDDRPLVQRAIGDRAISLTSGLLGSDLSNQAVSTLSDKTYAYVTSSDRQDIKIDLTAIKTPINSIITLAQDNNGKLASVQSQIPDEIVLIDDSTFPDLSGVVRLMLWLGPLFWLSTIALFSLYIYLGRNEYAKRVYTAGAFIIAVSVIGLMTSPFVPPPIAAALPNIELRPVAENLVSGFLAPFKAQMYHTIGYTLLALLIFNQRFNILALFRSLETRLNKQPKKKR